VDHARRQEPAVSELRPRSRWLLEAARVERTPSAADRERVFRALAAGALITGAAASAAAAPSLVVKLTKALANGWLLSGLAAALATGTYLTRAEHSTGAQPGVLAPALARPLNVLTPPRFVTPLPLPSGEVPSADAPTLAGTAGVKPRSAHATLEQELRQLHAAQAAYRDGHAQRALALIADHQRRFPRSQLGGERAVLEVLSLCRVGKQPQARKLAAQLRSTAASTAAFAGLETSCAATAK
jgi:hypothetical protein